MTEQSRHLADLQAVLSVARRLCATTDLADLLLSVEDAAQQVLDCEQATVFLYDEDHDRYQTPLDPDGTGKQPVDLDLTRRALEQEAPQHDESSNTWAFPLFGMDHRGVGIIEALGAQPLDPWDLELMQVFDSQVGVAVQRQLLLNHYVAKQRLERDLRLARDIQRGLLPSHNPAIDGFDIAGWNKPADDTGGDFFDFLPLPGGELALAIADATGHGIGPALVMAGCRALFRATVSATDELPHVLGRINRLLEVDLPDSRFVTACFGRLDPTTGSLSHLSAGQGPLLSYVAGRDAVEVRHADGLPLGLFNEVDYPSAQVRDMGPGDIEVWLTDGFFEWLNPADEEYGVDRASAFVRAHRTDPAAALIEGLYRDVLGFAGGIPQADDLTAVVVKRV